MNGVHDTGGQTCFGPIIRESDEPVFHADWERRVFAMMFLGGCGPIDASRHAIESMDPVDYLRTTYYEHWLAGLETLVEAQIPDDMPPTTETVTADMVDAISRAGSPADREVEGVSPRFSIGDRVVARNLHPAGHTRLPRYVRGRCGEIALVHGCHVFPDTNAHGQGEQPQPLYTVRFTAQELWGDSAPSRDCLHVDLWESYLEEAQS